MTDMMPEKIQIRTCVCFSLSGKKKIVFALFWNPSSKLYERLETGTFLFLESEENEADSLTIASSNQLLLCFNYGKQHRQHSTVGLL